jgi:hypothetical protein
LCQGVFEFVGNEIRAAATDGLIAAAEATGTPMHFRMC